MSIKPPSPTKDNPSCSSLLKPGKPSARLLSKGAKMKGQPQSTWQSPQRRWARTGWRPGRSGPGHAGWTSCAAPPPRCAGRSPRRSPGTSACWTPRCPRPSPAWTGSSPHSLGHHTRGNVRNKARTLKGSVRHWLPTEQKTKEAKNRKNTVGKPCTYILYSQANKLNICAHISGLVQQPGMFSEDRTVQQTLTPALHT